jgi:hypothetical protein
VSVRDPREVFRPAASVEYLARRASEGSRTLDLDLPQAATSPLGPIHALLERVQAVRGYNPLDVRRLKEFLKFIEGTEAAPNADAGFRRLTIVHKSLLDLLGVGFLLLPAKDPVTIGLESASSDSGWKRILVDRRPEVYVFTGPGMVCVPDYALYENLSILPRAFVVPRSTPLPPRRDLLAVLKDTDFRQLVYLEAPSTPESPHHADLPAADHPGEFRPAAICSYQPNRVVIKADGKTPGWLVLSDVWYPGWQCTVDGRPTKVYRADFAFRAVPVDAGPHEVIYNYLPSSLGIGRRITVTACCAVVGLLCLTLGWRFLSARSIR